MKVALGTIEIDDEARKKIRALKGEKGHATRNEVKEYLLGELDSTVIPNIGSDGAEAAAAAETPVGPEGDEQVSESPNHVGAASVSPMETAGGGLPEPTEAGDAAGGTTTTGGDTPTTGNLGSDGTPGGTV